MHGLRYATSNASFAYSTLPLVGGDHQQKIHTVLVPANIPLAPDSGEYNMQSWHVTCRGVILTKITVHTLKK